EPSLLGRQAESRHFRDETVEQRLSRRRLRRGRETGSRPLAGVGCERELRHEQEATADVGDAQVHPPRVVRKYSVFDQPLGETFRLGLAVASLDTDEDQEAAPDARDDLAVNGHGCTADALPQAYHRTIPERGISCRVCYEQT